MDIHKPKPVENWRDFISEIGVIVCGIVIALGLEQAVEAVHWAERVHEAKAAIHKELVMATVFGEERIARRNCANAYLSDLATAVVASPSQWTPRPTTFCGLVHEEVYVGLSRPWPSEVWRSIEAEGTVSHFDEQHRRGAPFTFDFIKDTGELGAEESREATQLDPLAYPITLTPDGRIGFLKVIGSLRRKNDLLALSASQINTQVAALGEKPTETELQKVRASTPFLFRAPPAGAPHRP
jgi:hypothetical protein